ncbi:stage VI sporulation protein D [Bacillus gobiensis]|uniref:stage VI sporulation protein D n=1 Tax=Bacillus gobiensis TaxID=1441095 RepID=UPI003D1A28B5
MSQNNRLQFSVEETVSFEKGHEVGELISISIEPDILVQEVNDYVSLRGYLELTGEYHLNEEKEEHVPEATDRMIQSIEIREDGIADLEHKFPVDITIPAYRVGHLNDIFVFIDAFDYRLDHSNVLTIQADLAIEGLLDEGSEAVHEEIESEEFEAAARNEFHTLEETAEEESNETEAITSDIQETSAAAPNELEKEQSDETEEAEELTLSYRAFPSELESGEKPYFSEPNLLKEEDEEEDESTFEIEVKQENVALEEEREEIVEQTYPEFTFQSPEFEKEKQQPELVREYEHEDSEQVRENDNSLYLTKLFTRQEEEEFSKLKMYIVQQEDTIDLICERYELNVQNLIRVNSLSPEDEVTEGQILFIPDYKSSLSH